MFNHSTNYSTNNQNSQQVDCTEIRKSQLPQLRSTGLTALKILLKLILPVLDSKELWFKLGHNKFIVGNYTADGHFKAWHTKGSGQNRVRTRLIPNFWEYVSNWAQNNNGGVFFIPTQPQGYPTKEAIEVSDDVAAELDDGTLEEQWPNISEFVEITGLQPAYIVYSGSKSYHPHWKATEHLPIEQTIYLRQLVCIALNSDPAISNPHQPMRLPGFYRREKEQEQTLEYWSNFRYTYEELIAGIKAYFKAKKIPFPEDISEERWRIYKRAKRNGDLDLSILTKPESELYPQRKVVATPVVVSTSYSGSIPLELALSQANQKALKGVGSERNNTGLALAKDLIGCHNWLTSSGYSVTGNPYNLFINYCQSCSSGNGWNSREWETIWHSASRGNPQPARRDLTKFVHWFRWENDSEYKQAAIAEWKLKNPQSATSEPDLAAYQEYLAWEAEEEKVDEAIACSEFVEWLLAKAKGLGKRFKKGFGQYCRQNITFSLPKTIKYHPNTPLPSSRNYQGKKPPKIKFSKGQRHEVIAKLRALGWPFVLDRSFMGQFKSHDMGQFANSAGKTWYLDLNHRNPTTGTVERNFTDLPVRHNGLNYDPMRSTPLGNPYQIWAGDGDENPDIKSLCHKGHLFIKLQNKGYNPGDLGLEDDEKAQLNPICGNCQHFGVCGIKRGNGYGFRHVRQQALAHLQIRASIDSLPGVDSWDYRSNIAIVDEASQCLRGVKSVTADSKDFAVKMAKLEKYPELYGLLKPLRLKLNPLLDGEEKLAYNGLNHQNLIELLGNPPEELEEAIAVVAETNPAFRQIFFQSDRVSGWGKKWRNSMSTANWYLNQEAIAQTKNNIDALPSNFLVDLLAVWGGFVPGSLRIDRRRRLTVTTNDPRHGEILRAMDQVIMLDATANKSMLAKRLNINPDSIIEIEQELPNLDNLTVVNVGIEGMNSNQWSDNCQNRIEALIEHLEANHQDLPVLGLKKYADCLNFQGWWFNDNRGSNAFKARKVIAAFGKPQINLGVVEDEYLTLYGNLDGFEDYYQSLIDAEVTQLIGRPRAHLYPEQQFVVYLVATGHQLDYLHDLGINIVNRHAFEICPEAGTPKQISQHRLIKAVSNIFQRGETKLTCGKLAAESGLSPNYIKKLTAGAGGMMAFKKWVLTLYNSYRSSSRFLEPDFLLEDAKIKTWLGLEPLEATKEILNEVKNYGWRDFQTYLDTFSVEIQADIWGLIAPLIFPESALAELKKLLLPPPDIGNSQKTGEVVS